MGITKSNPMILFFNKTKLEHFFFGHKIPKPKTIIFQILSQNFLKNLREYVKQAHISSIFPLITN